MVYSHSNVYIVRVKDTDSDGETRTWFVGPYGSSRADTTADALENNAPTLTRECFVEALYSDDECLRVDDYTRRALDSTGHIPSDLPA